MRLNSSVLLAATHYGASQELHIVFRPGNRHERAHKIVYVGVDERVYMELCLAASAGRYYTTEIRGCYARKEG